MHGRDPRQTSIAGVERTRDGREPRHQPIGLADVTMAAPQQPLDLIAVANNKAAVVSLDQRRPAKQ